MNSSNDEQSIQRAYYERTAQEYDTHQVDPRDEHFFALNVLAGAMEFYGIESVLDVGAGTGRVARFFASRGNGPSVMSIEPVAALRNQGYRLGVPEDQLIDGDATRLVYLDGAFDLVCEFGVLHHIKSPRAAISEMLRVAKKAVFISDCNNFGQGSKLVRFVKQSLDLCHLWPLVDWVKTRGTGYTLSEADGLAYSYSVFNDYDLIRRQCPVLHLFNTRGCGGSSLYRSADHIGLLGVKSA